MTAGTMPACSVRCGQAADGWLDGDPLCADCAGALLTGEGLALELQLLVEDRSRPWRARPGRYEPTDADWQEMRRRLRKVKT